MTFFFFQFQLVVELMDYMNLHQKLQLLQFLLKHLCNYMLHFYYFPRILLQKYLDMLFLLLLLFQRLYSYRKDPFTIIFCPTFSKISVFRFAISVLQIMLSPTPLRQFDYSIFDVICQKMYVIVKSLYFSIFNALISLFVFFYIFITYILHLC